jgi:ankyrin repeat protein
LTWKQQQQMLDEMKEAAEGINQYSDGLLEMKKSVAAFYVFQCYLQEFGTIFNPEEAVRWLQKASSDDNSHEDADYFSQAWLWRISRALGVESNLTNERLDVLLPMSIVRGHRTSLQDMQQLAASSEGAIQQYWLNRFQLFRNILLSQMGAVGMGYFLPKYLTRPWDTMSLENMTELDDGIRTVLGSEYDSCLKSSTSSDSGFSTQTNRDKKRTAFDRIYVNSRGHGPLHYAAATGAVNALRHMVTKYECDINIPNQHVDETPLVCACEGGKLDCALLLINNGADPNGYRFGEEGPLHWLCSFPPTEMETIASRLVVAGADLELRSGGMRHDVRGIRADWEHIFEIRTTPLGRAVLMDNLDAVRILLKLGANSLTKSANKHPGGIDVSTLIDVSSPFELAAVLTLPEILADFIKHIDGSSGTTRLKLLDEASMLDLAHDRKVTQFDPLSLQSRLVRCGANWKRNLRATLSLLYKRAQPFHGNPGDELQKERSRVLCKEVTLGNVDIVESLLELGYSANGTEDYRPLEKAIEMNHEELFNLLMRHKADPTVTRLTAVGSISMLQVSASRPRQSRPGRGISDGLIAAGIPIESADPRTRPPLATAISNQNFDVAQALIENGANVNAIYPLQFGSPNGPETKTVSVLVEVLSQHTMSTIESLKFLFGKQTGGPEQRPAFHIDPSNKFSILHFLAGSPQFTQIAQITPKILNLCLEAYAEHSLINYKHPLFGTALYHAAANGHKPMVERLLEYGADATYNAGPDVEESVQILLRPRESWTPLWAAILRFDDELKTCTLFPPEGSLGQWLKSNSIHNVEKTIDLLSKSNDDGLAKQAIEQIRQRKESLETEFYKLKIEKVNKRRDLKAREDEAPVDLGILSKEGREEDEKKIREICEGPEQEWRDGAIDGLLKSLKL